VTFERDPLSTWFDPRAQAFLISAYADYGTWVTGWCPVPTLSQRYSARTLGINVDETDANEQNRWLRAFKRSCRWNLRMYGYGRDLRPGRARTFTRSPLTLMWWDSSAGVVLRPVPMPHRAHEIRVKLTPNSIDPLHPAAAPADDIARRSA
jgi:hypothetical protein